MSSFRPNGMSAEELLPHLIGRGLSKIMLYNFFFLVNKGLCVLF
jgi:hypothetical protein